MQKRIAIISYHTCPLASCEGKETGGMNIYVLGIAKALAEQGFAIDVFTRSQDTTQPKVVTLNKNLRVIHIKAGPETYLLPNTNEQKDKLFSYVSEFVAGIEVFEEEQGVTYDIFDCHYYLSGLAGIALQKKHPQTPLIMTFHTLALMKNLTTPAGISTEEKRRIDTEVMLTQKATIIVAPSEKESIYLQTLYDAPKEKIHIVAPGVDTKLFHPIDQVTARKAINAPLDQKLVMFVGRIEPIKGLDMLLYAMKIMIKQHPTLSVCLWLVGKNGERKDEIEKLEQLQKFLHLTTSVQFINQQPQDKLPYYYNAADLVVMPSHYESFGTSALEAIVCGVPVIPTNVTGVSTLLNEKYNSLITTVNNPLLLAEQMAHVLQKPQKKTVLGNVEEFDWATVAQKISRLYSFSSG